jgi:UDP:flavonoid glycosyltransferase YjiC (YdhE family)
MTVDQVYNILKFIVRKNQLGSLSPDDFAYAFNTAQRNYYDFLVGRIEQYQYGRAVPRVGLSMTDNVVSRLMPFESTATITITSGLATKPSDFNKSIGIYTPNNYRVYRVEENRFAERMQDSIDPVDEANAFYVEQNTNWRIYPTSLTSIILKYLTVPVDVKWNYTLDGSGRPVYISSGSVQPLWKDNDIDELVGRAAKIIGVSFKEPTLSQFGQGVINTGE